METVFSTQGLAPGEAAEYWLDFATSSYCPHIAGLTVEGTVLNKERFFAQGQLAPLPDAALTSLELSASHLARTAKHIGQGNEEIVYIVTPVRGTFTFVQHGRTITVAPGDLYFEDTRYPFELLFPTRAKAVGLAVPAEMMSQRIGPVDSFGAGVIRRGDPLGAMAIQYLLTLATSDNAQLITPDSWRLRDVALDLAAMALGQLTHQTPRLHAHADTAKTRLVQAMLRHVENPETTVAAIAHDAAMSSRYAGSLMAESGTTVSRRLWELRLERAKRRLADPAFDANTIAEIAAGCGFPDQSHFTRRFRAAEGMTPGEYRRLVRENRPYDEAFIAT